MMARVEVVALMLVVGVVVDGRLEDRGQLVGRREAFQRLLTKLEEAGKTDVVERILFKIAAPRGKGTATTFEDTKEADKRVVSDVNEVEKLQVAEVGGQRHKHKSAQQSRQDHLEKHTGTHVHTHAHTGEEGHEEEHMHSHVHTHYHDHNHVLKHAAEHQHLTDFVHSAW